MNYIINILILIIMIGLFNLRQKHIEKNMIFISAIFLISLLCIFYLQKPTKENYINSATTELDITLLEKGNFEMMVHTRNYDQNLYLHTTTPTADSKSDCVLSGHIGCNDVCVVNKIRHDQRPHKWSFNNLGRYFEIKYKDSYLSSTDKGDDCASIYDKTDCKDVILLNKSAYENQDEATKTYWVLEKIENPSGTVGATYYAIRAYINDEQTDLYLYCILKGDGDDGQDCEQAGLKGFGCRNVVLAPQDSHTFSQTQNPVYWRLFLDPSSVPESIMNKSDEIQIQISENILPGWKTTKMNLAGQTYNQFINTNKDVGLRFDNMDDAPSGSKFRSINIGTGGDWVSVPKDSKYILKNIHKKLLKATEDDGYSCSSYDNNQHYLCIKESDDPNIETTILTIPAGQTNFATPGNCVVTLSSLNDKKKDTSDNVIDEDANTVAMTGFEESPKIHLWLNNEIVINKVIIKQHTYSPFTVKIYNSNKELEYSSVFTDSDKATESIYVIDDITLKGRYLVVELTKKGILALNNIYVIGANPASPNENESVKKTIKNERAICNIIKNQEKEKHLIQLGDKIKEAEVAIREKTVNDILSFINTPQSVIMWENISIPSNGVKIELLRKEYLHISNIQVFGTSTRELSSVDKDWTKDNDTKVTMSSVFTDDSETYFGPEKAVDDNLDTYCRSNNTDNPYPSITIKFGEEINIDKIIIYNRKDKNRHRLVPCKISLLNSAHETIVHAIKKSFKSNLEISKSFMESPMGCLSFKELGITDIGDVNKFRGWADVEGNGMKCNFCRVVGNQGQQFFSCAGSAGDNQYKYNSFPNVDLGSKDSIFMSDVYGSNKDDFCRCVGNRYNKRVECLVNNINEPNIGFNSIHQPNITCNGRTGEEIQKELHSNVNGKDMTIDNRIDTGFYDNIHKHYYLFKNTKIDNKSMVLYVILNKDHHKISGPSLVTTGMNSEFESLNKIFKEKIDCTFSDGGDFVYFFRDSLVSKYNIRNHTVADNYPVKIKVEFPDLPFNTIDEAYYAGDGIAIFFKGSKFVQYNISNNSNKKMRVVVSHIAQGNFGNLNFDGIDTAVSFNSVENNEIQEVLFTRNDKCLIYNNSESQNDSEYNSVVNIMTKYPNLWDINLDRLNSHSRKPSNTNYQVESSIPIEMPPQTEPTLPNPNVQNNSVPTNTTVPASNNQQVSGDANQSTQNMNERNQYIEPTITDQSNLYSSCNLPSTSIKDQSYLLGQNNQKNPPVCTATINKPNKKKIIKDIIRSGNLTTYLNNTDKDINTLSCELDITPSKIMIEASKGTFSNALKLIKFFKSTQKN